MPEITMEVLCKECKNTHLYLIHYDKVRENQNTTEISDDSIDIVFFGGVITSNEPKEIYTREFYCPNKNKFFDYEFNIKHPSSIIIENVLGPELYEYSSEKIRNDDLYTSVVYDIGKSIIVESISKGREFNKFMVGISFSGITVFIVLLKFINTETSFLASFREMMIIIPNIIFLIAGGFFIYGCLPYYSKLRVSELKTNAFNSILIERKRIIKIISIVNKIGLVLFYMAVILAILILASMIAIPEADTINLV